MVFGQGNARELILFILECGNPENSKANHRLCLFQKKGKNSTANLNRNRIHLWNHNSLKDINLFIILYNHSLKTSQTEENCKVLISPLATFSIKRVGKLKLPYPLLFINIHKGTK